jgi:hypothetical protein
VWVAEGPRALRRAFTGRWLRAAAGHATGAGAAATADFDGGGRGGGKGRGGYSHNNIASGTARGNISGEQQRLAQQQHTARLLMRNQQHLQQQQQFMHLQQGPMSLLQTQPVPELQSASGERASTMQMAMQMPPGGVPLPPE